MRVTQYDHIEGADILSDAVFNDFMPGKYITKEFIQFMAERVARIRTDAINTVKFGGSYPR